MNTVLEIDETGNVSCLYTDEINLYDIGMVQNVTRASHIEFDEQTQEWIVIHAKSCEILFRHKNRESAIEWEIENLKPGGKYYENFYS